MNDKLFGGKREFPVRRMFLCKLSKLAKKGFNLTGRKSRVWKLIFDLFYIILFSPVEIYQNYYKLKKK